MGYETNGRATSTSPKDHGDNGGVFNVIVVFDENDPQPRVISIDPADFIDSSGNIQMENIKNWSQKSTDPLGITRIGNTNNWPQKTSAYPGNIRIGNANNWCQNSKRDIHVFVADEATTTEVTDVTTNTDALIANAAVVTDINNSDPGKTYKPVETLTETIHVCDKGMLTDAPTVNKGMSTDKYTANKATHTDVLNNEISTNTKRVKFPNDFGEVLSKTKDIKGTSKIITIEAPPSVSTASSAYIPVDMECKGTVCTGTRLPRTDDLSIDPKLIPHRVPSNLKIVDPKYRYTDMREAAVKAVSDIAATAEKIVAPKVNAKEDVKDIATEPDKNIKIATKNAATMFAADAKVSPNNGRVFKTKRKFWSLYPSPTLSSSGDSTAGSCCIIYSSTVS